MIRFLKYSLENKKKIRVMLLSDQGITQENVLITAFDTDSITFLSSKAKKPLSLPFDSLLSAGYARGDKGELD